MLAVQNRFIVESEEETAAVANEFAHSLHGNEVIAFYGELGAGKTFFIKHMLKKFGISNISSPTFSIVNEYHGSIKVNHFDFYRINRVEELYDIGFDDYMNDSSLTLIEWADLYKEILPKRFIEIFIKFAGDFSREIVIKNNE